MTKPLIGSSHLNLIGNPINTPLGVNVANFSVFYHPKIESFRLHPPKHHTICMSRIEVESPSGRLWLYETFEDFRLDLHQKEFDLGTSKSKVKVSKPLI